MKMFVGTLLALLVFDLQSRPSLALICFNLSVPDQFCDRGGRKEIRRGLGVGERMMSRSRCFSRQFVVYAGHVPILPYFDPIHSIFSRRLLTI